MKKIICLIMLLFAATVINAHAEDNTLLLNFYSRTQTLQIMANTDNKFGQAVTAVIVPEGTDPSKAEIGDSIIDIFNTKENGVVEGSIVLPDNLAGGKYAVQLFPFKGGVEYFMYINKPEATSMLSVINEAKTNMAIQNVINTNYKKIGIDNKVFDSVDSSDVARLFNSYRNSGNYTDFYDYYDDYCIAEVTALIKAGEPVAKLLQKYQKYLGIDYSKDYEPLSVETKKCLDDMLKTEDEKQKISEQYYVLRVLAIAQAAENWTKLKEVLVENESIWGPDKTYFNKLVLKDKVYQELFDKKKGLTSLEILKNTFYNSSKTLYNQEQKDNKINETSGGGGGGMSAPTVSNQPISENSFNDMTNHWAKSQVEKLVKKGIISGYPNNTFCPDNEITRAEFITILVKGFPQNVAYETSFVDVPEGAWYESYLAQAQAAGIVVGDSEKRAFPNEPITRQDAAVMLKRALSRYSIDFAESGEAFSDSGSISAYAKDAVYSLVGGGIISGMGDGTFAPAGKTTRAQAAVLLGRAMDKLGGIQ